MITTLYMAGCVQILLLVAVCKMRMSCISMFEWPAVDAKPRLFEIVQISRPNKQSRRPRINKRRILEAIDRRLSAMLMLTSCNILVVRETVTDGEEYGENETERRAERGMEKGRVIRGNQKIKKDSENKKKCYNEEAWLEEQGRLIGS